MYISENLNSISCNTFLHALGSSYAGGQWAAGDEPLYYIVSPKDVVIAKPRSGMRFQPLIGSYGNVF